MNFEYITYKIVICVFKINYFLPNKYFIFYASSDDEDISFLFSLFNRYSKQLFAVQHRPHKTWINDIEKILLNQFNKNTGCPIRFIQTLLLISATASRHFGL